MGIYFLFNHPCNCLVRIETLVLITAILLVLRYILDMFRHISINIYLQVLLLILSGLPYALLNYTIGVMQLTESNNDVYQVWAVVLVTLQYSIGATRPSGIFRKQNPLMDIMSSLWTANLLSTRVTLLEIPLWLLWSLNSLRIMLGFADKELTSSRHRKHLRLITEYMRTEHEHPPLEHCDAKHMKGYKYLVWGEDKQKIKSDQPDYRVRLEVTKKNKFITTDKVWEQNGGLLCETRESNENKDLCLAFALFKLLHRRFFDLPIHEANQKKTEEFFLKGLIQNDKNDKNDRAFQIIEAELAFLNDHFFTRYPAIFARGFPFWRLGLSPCVIGVALYLTYIFNHSSGRLADDLSKTTNGNFVTRFVIAMLAMKEIWEIISYALSDWTKVGLILSFVEHPLWTRCTPIVASTKFLCKRKIGKRWHGTFFQYNLLQSFQCKSWLRSLVLTWSHRVFYKHDLRTLPGYKRSSRITILKEIKLAISKSLQEFCDRREDMQKYLSTVANSLHPHLEEKIPLTSESATETEKILVWHIATCYCEIKCAKTSQNPATALSQYSAHLLARRSRYLPDRSLVATNLFRSTIGTTRELLQSSKSWDDVIVKLDNLAKKNDHKDDKDGDPNLSKWMKRTKRQEMLEKRREKWRARSRVITDKIIKVGVKLGGSLLELLVENENETCVDTKLWEFLEKFWARYLLHLAASVRPDDHKKLLSVGGEFLTHVWALLFHAGLLGKTDKDRLSAGA